MNKHFTKLSAMAFSGLRRLNPFICHLDDPGPIDTWMNEREIYQLGDINIFAGRNGAGKSTVLELVEFLSNVDRICTLPRENRNISSHCLFQLWFASPATLLARVLPNAISHGSEEVPLNPWDWQYLQISGVTADDQKLSFSGNVGKTHLETETRTALERALQGLNCRVSVWNTANLPPKEKLAAILNSIAPHLSGLVSDPDAPKVELPFGAPTFKRLSPLVINDECQDSIGVYHSDDPRQFNYVQPSALPAGWRAIASLIYYLHSREAGEICLLEEPETHLHPTLQRAVARIICDLVKKMQLQLFIATHSMTFQSRFVWQKDFDVRYFEADAHELRIGINERKMLDRLGISGAELGTANGVVWVEGPSDRLYYKHWIELFCQATQTPEPLEHIDYSFAFHGGSVLAHFSPHIGEEHIDISRINRNFVVVVDKDLESDDGHIIDGAKEGIRDWVQSIASPKCDSLTTPRYTIESSLPRAFRDVYFTEVDGRLRVRGRKVVIAERYCKAYQHWDDCFDHDEPMRDLVSSLVRLINAWRIEDPIATENGSIATPMPQTHPSRELT